MKAIIIEDEKLSAEHLATLLKRVDAGIEISATYDSVKRSIEEFKNGVKADLLFVDVHLADGLSFEIFLKLPSILLLFLPPRTTSMQLKLLK